MHGECRSTDELDGYLLGKLDDSASTVLEQHVWQCDACRETLHDCEATHDTIITLLKHGDKKDQFSVEPQLRAAMQQIHQLSQNLNHDSTPEASSSAGVADTFVASTQLGPYQLLEQRGSGGMGTVFRAEHTDLGMIVAVKVLSEYLTHNERAISRFHRETRAVGGLNHPHIVRATDAGEYGGRHFLAMEFLDGDDLAHALTKHGGFAVPDACECIQQASEGIHHAHENGIIHRDVKPSNLMLTSEGQIKVLDLGLVRLLTPEVADDLTSNFDLMGSADYMAPEQIARAKDVDERVDVYSLGCTLYALLCGRPPFADEHHRTQHRKLIAHEQEAPLPIAELRPEVPRELSDIVDRALAKSPDERFASAAEFAEALESFAAGADLKRLASTPDSPATDARQHFQTADSISQSSSNSEHGTADVVRNLRRRLAIATLIAAIILTAAFLLSTPFKQSPLTATLDVRVLRGTNAPASLNHALPLRTNDQLQLQGTLSRPAYAALLWQDADGIVHVMNGGTQGPVTSISYPSDEDRWVTLEGTVGTELLLLVTSNERINELSQLVSQLESGGRIPNLNVPGAIWLSSREIRGVAAQLSADEEKRFAIDRAIAGKTRSPGQIVSGPIMDAQEYLQQLQDSVSERFGEFHGIVVTHQ